MDRGEVVTPVETVRFMVDRLGEVEGKRILEPGAGEGSFVRELLSRGADPKQITVFDTNPDFETLYKDLGINYRISDFLLEESPIEAQPFFDCVIGNPPYLSRHSSYLRTHRKSLLKRFEEIGVYDTYSLFMYHGLRFLKPGGILCFIVSDSFLTIGYHYKLRRSLLENYRLREILLPPRNLFSQQGVNNSPCIIVIEKSNPGSSHEVAFTDRLKNEQEYYNPPRVSHLPQRNFLKIDGYPISLGADSFAAGLFSSLPSIGEVMEGHIGLHTHDNRRFIAAVQGTKLSERFSRQGRMVIPRRFIRQGRTVIPRRFITGKGQWRPYLKKGGEERYYREIEEAVDWSPEAIAQYDIPSGGDLFLREGIIISGVSRRLAARYMPPGCLWDSNKAIGFVAKDSDISLWYLLGLFNSRLYNFLAKGILNTTNSLQIGDIRRLSFKYPSRQQKSAVERMVKRIVKKLKKNPGYDYSQEQEQIDEVIFELYRVPQERREFIKASF